MRWVTPRRPKRASRSAQRLARLGQHHRALADQRAQQDLQTAVAADVVEGAPDRRYRARRRRSDGAGQPLQRVDDHFRGAGRAGGEHHPFGLGVVGGRLGKRLERGADRCERHVERLDRRRRRVEHGRLDAGRGGDAGKVVVVQVRRADDDAPREPVEFDQRDRGCERALGSKQHRAPAQGLPGGGAERRAGGDVGEPKLARHAPQASGREPRRGPKGRPERSARLRHARERPSRRRPRSRRA